MKKAKGVRVRQLAMKSATEIGHVLKIFCHWRILEKEDLLNLTAICSTGCCGYQKRAQHGGRNTKIHAVEVLSSATIYGSVVMGDKAYGTSEIRNYIETSGGSCCIPPKSNSVEPWDCDYHLYKKRHAVECFFNKLK